MARLGMTRTDLPRSVCQRGESAAAGETESGRLLDTLRYGFMAMDAIKPWHLFICLIVVVMIAGVVVAVVRAGRRR